MSVFSSFGNQFGMMNGGYQPPVNGMLPMGPNPMFGGGGPRFTGPFNMQMQSDTGRIFQMMAPMLLNSLMGGTGRQPFQVWPEQNLADQTQANDYYRGQQQAAAIGSARDAMQATQVMQGITRMRTGREPNMVESAVNARYGQTISQFTPMLTQLLGPTTVDALYGSRGSSAVMSQELHAAMRTRLDPVTGQSTFSGQSAGAAGQEVFERLFGARGPGPMGLHGMSAGQAGMLVNELQSRGTLGGGGVDGARMRALGNAFYDDSFIHRSADRLVAERAGTPGVLTRDAALTQVRGTRDRIMGEPGLSVEQIGGMAGGGDFLRAGAGGQMAERVRSLSGVVRAMRDIFGDMGNPNAPMRELMNGLDALTQSSITQMNPAQLESMVRRSHNIARQTGIGIQGLLSLTAQGAAIGDQLGLHRSLSVGSAQNAALFGAATQDAQRTDLPMWGRQSQEQVTLLRNQLNQHAAASPLANNLGALRRMQSMGLIADGAGTETQAILQAAMNGQADYTFRGRHSVNVSRDRLIEMLQREHGISDSTAAAMLADRHGNQEFIGGAIHDLVSGEMQRREMDADAGRSFGGTLNSGLQSNNARAALQAAGIAPVGRGARNNSEAVSTVSQRLGNLLATDFGNMSPEMRASHERTNTYLAGQAQHHLREQIHTANPGMSGAQLDAAVGRIGAGLGPQGFGGLVAGMIPQFNTDLSGTAYGNAVGWWQQRDTATGVAAQGRGRAAEAQGLRQSAMAGFGQNTVVGRISDVISRWAPGTDIRGALSDVLGGVDLDHLPGGPNSNASVAARRARAMSTTSRPEDMPGLRRDRDVVTGLLGDREAARRARAAPGPPLDADTRRRLDAVEAGAVGPADAPAAGGGERDEFGGAAVSATANPLSMLGDLLHGGATHAIGGLRAASAGATNLETAQATAARTLVITGTLTIRRDGTATINGTAPMTATMSVTP